MLYQPPNSGDSDAFASWLEHYYALGLLLVPATYASHLVAVSRASVRHRIRSGHLFTYTFTLTNDHGQKRDFVYLSYTELLIWRGARQLRTNAEIIMADKYN